MSRRIKFESLTPAQLKTVLGEYNNHMKYLQDRLDIKISQRQGDFCLSGDVTGVERGERIIYKLVKPKTQKTSVQKSCISLSNLASHVIKIWKMTIKTPITKKMRTI